MDRHGGFGLLRQALAALGGQAPEGDGELAAEAARLLNDRSAALQGLLVETGDHLAGNHEAGSGSGAEANVSGHGPVGRIGAGLAVGDGSEATIPLAVRYRNWRGEVSVRTITPRKLWYGATDWHPEPQWLLTAWDHDKDALRDFALQDFLGRP